MLTVDWDKFKYRQLHWANIVEVYTIAVPVNAPHHNVNNWDYCVKNDISKHDYCKHGYGLLYHSIGHPHGSRKAFWHQLAHKTRCHNDDNDHEYRMWPYQRENSNTFPTCQLSAVSSQTSYTAPNVSPAITTIMMNTGFDPINERNWIAFLQVIRAQSSVGEPTINGAILSHNWQYCGRKARDNCKPAQLPLHPFKLSKVHRLQ